MNPLIFFCMIYAEKDTLSFTAPIPLVLVVSVSITTCYMLSIAIVVWFCCYSIHRPRLTLLTTTYYSTDLNLSLQLVVKHCSHSNPIFLNILSLLVSTWINPYLKNCGVPQGFVLDPVLYLLYTSPVADILRRHNMAFKLRNCMLMTPSCMLLSPAMMTWDYNLP